MKEWYLPGQTTGYEFIYHKKRVARYASFKRRGSMANIVTTQKDSIVDQLEQLHQRIARRAYD